MSPANRQTEEIKIREEAVAKMQTIIVPHLQAAAVSLFPNAEKNIDVIFNETPGSRATIRPMHEGFDLRAYLKNTPSIFQQTIYERLNTLNQIYAGIRTHPAITEMGRITEGIRNHRGQPPVVASIRGKLAHIEEGRALRKDIREYFEIANPREDNPELKPIRARILAQIRDSLNNASKGAFAFMEPSDIFRNFPFILEKVGTDASKLTGPIAAQIFQYAANIDPLRPPTKASEMMFEKPNESLDEKLDRIRRQLNNLSKRQGTLDQVVDMTRSLLTQYVDSGIGVSFHNSLLRKRNIAATELDGDTGQIETTRDIRKEIQSQKGLEGTRNFQTLADVYYQTVADTLDGFTAINMGLFAHYLDAIEEKDRNTARELGQRAIELTGIETPTYTIKHITPPEEGATRKITKRGTLIESYQNGLHITRERDYYYDDEDSAALAELAELKEQIKAEEETKPQTLEQKLNATEEPSFTMEELAEPSFEYDEVAQVDESRVDPDLEFLAKIMPKARKHEIINYFRDNQPLLMIPWNQLGIDSNLVISRVRIIINYGPCNLEISYKPVRLKKDETASDRYSKDPQLEIRAYSTESDYKVPQELSDYQVKKIKGTGAKYKTQFAAAIFSAAYDAFNEAGIVRHVKEYKKIKKETTPKEDIGMHYAGEKTLAVFMEKINLEGGAYARAKASEPSPVFETLAKEGAMLAQLAKLGSDSTSGNPLKDLV